MKLRLKYPRIIDGKHLRPGIHEVSDHLENHWFVKGLLKNGDAVLLEVPKQPVIQEAKVEEHKAEESVRSEEAQMSDKAEISPEEQLEMPEKKKEHHHKRHGKR